MSHTLRNGDTLAINTRALRQKRVKQNRLYTTKAERPDGGDYSVTIFPLIHVSKKNSHQTKRRRDALLNLSRPAIATYLGAVETLEYSGEVFYTPELAAPRSNASRILPAVLFDELRYLLPALVELHKAGLRHGRLGCLTIRQTLAGAPIITGMQGVTLEGSAQEDVRALAQYCAEVLGAEPKIPVDVFLKYGNRRINKRLHRAIKGALGDGGYSAISTMAAFHEALLGKRITRPSKSLQKRLAFKHWWLDLRGMFEVKRPAPLSEAFWSGLAGVTAVCVGATTFPGIVTNASSDELIAPKVERLQMVHAVQSTFAPKEISLADTWMDQVNATSTRKTDGKQFASAQTASLVSVVSGLPIRTSISLTVGGEHHSRIRRPEHSVHKAAPLAKIIQASYVPDESLTAAKIINSAQKPAPPAKQALEMADVAGLVREKRTETVSEALKDTAIAEKTMPIPVSVRGADSLSTPAPVIALAPKPAFEFVSSPVTKLPSDKIDAEPLGAKENIQSADLPDSVARADPIFAPVAMNTTVSKDSVKPLRKIGDVFQDCNSCPEMKVLPGLEAGHSLAVALTETTVAQYRIFIDVGADGGEALFAGRARGPFSPGFEQSDKHPVTYVSREEAAAYAQWLSEKTGVKYRLPTSQEWDYLANASQAVSFKPAKQCAFANGADAALLAELPRRQAVKCNDKYVATAPVRSFPMTTNGLYDMLGNVSEWTSDGADKGLPMSRGGSWMSHGESFSLKAASIERKGTRAGDIGFRLVRDLD